MHQVTRKGNKLGGTYPIYDGREDAIAHGISSERIKHWKDYSLAIGDYAEYSDGIISEVIRAYKRKHYPDKRNPNWKVGPIKAQYITTRLNCYSQSQSDVTSKCLPYSSSTAFLKPETISTNRYKFAEAWILGGMEIGEACQKYLWQSRLGKKENWSYRTYAYVTISLPWFDELLANNRLIRDRYMTLVGALGTVGIDEAYVADKLKEGMESLNVKEKINALNKVIDLLEINAAKKRIPIQASWQVESPSSPKQLSEPANINSILEDTLHEHIGSTISETQRVETVPAINQVEVGRSPSCQTDRDTSVSPETTDSERVLEFRQVASA